VRVLGPDHPDTLGARAHLARYLGEAGQAALAASQFSDLLADCLRVLGPGHPLIRTAQDHLAYWQDRQEAGED
jgi:hypothetical protein